MRIGAIDSEAGTMEDQPLTPHLTMKWKLNRRQQLVSGQEVYALSLHSFFLPLLL